MIRITLTTLSSTSNSPHLITLLDAIYPINQSGKKTNLMMFVFRSFKLLLLSGKLFEENSLAAVELR